MGIELRTAFDTLAKKNVTQRFRKQENCGAKQGCEQIKGHCSPIKKFIGALQTLHFVLPKLNFKTN